jgi:predicted nucleotidyltransferase
VIRGDPNVARVEAVVAALGDLCDELVLVGGCAVGLLIDTPSAPLPRVTTDVDLVAEVTALRDYHALERRFAKRGLTRDVSRDAPICRWRAGDIAVDLVPTDPRVLGFSNRWYDEATRSALRVELPGGAWIHLIAAPAFLATKFEAFHTRGNSDLMASHDFEDIVNVVAGRAAVVEEVRTADVALRDYLTERFAAVIARADFENVLPGLVAHDELHEERVVAVAARIAALAG